MTGQRSWNDIEYQAVWSLLVDGEFLALIHPIGEYGFQLEILDAYRLDIWHNSLDEDRKRVRLGVEVNALNKPTGYYIRDELADPRIAAYAIGPYGKVSRHSAANVIHFFVPEWPHQTRGVPQIASALDRIETLDDYELSEADRANLDSHRLGFVKRNEYGYGIQETGKDDKDVPELDDDGYTLTELPDGAEFTPWDSSHPTSNYDPFTRSQLRAIAAGNGLPYHDMASDYGSVNFSAGRLARLSSQELYKRMQRIITAHLHRRVFAQWMKAADLHGKVTMPQNARVKWIPRRWQHIQPREEATAYKINVETGLQSRAAIIRDRGDDPAEVFAELAEEAERNPPAQPPAQPPQQPSEDAA